MRFLLLTLCLFFANGIWAKPNIAFLNPATDSHPFWEKTAQFMRAAANQLGINLQVYYMPKSGITNRFQYYKMAETALNNKPDYLLFINLKGTGLKILQLAEQSQTQAIIFNSDILAQEKSQFGLPRGQFKYWLAHLSPNDHQAGALLATTLIKQLPAGGTANIIGLNGSFNSSTAKLRMSGLEQAAAKQSAILHQVTRSNSWTAEEGYKKTKVLLKRYPQCNIIWAASDSLSLGAAKATSQQQKKSAIIIGGVDWSDEGIEAVKQGTLAASVGGHFIGGGIALVLAYDHYNQFDFAPSLGTQIVLQMYPMTLNNLPRCAPHLTSTAFKLIDFKTFTQTHSKQPLQPNFLANLPFAKHCTE